MTDYLETDVLVIGCGIAGGVTALRLADAGVKVTVVTRAPEPYESNTYYAQGGIIYRGRNDSPALLVEDVLRAGAGQCNATSVAILAEQGPELVHEILLKRVGVRFDQTQTGALALTLEGGHRLPRIIHAADATGKAIAAALVEALRQHPRVALLSGYTAVDLLMAGQPGRKRPAGAASPLCVGAYLLDQASGRVSRCLAKNTVLATGGLGQIFKRSTNPPGARGDGVAMARRAGAQVRDLEFVQFHPTTFYHPQAQPFLISEAVRGAGARLVDANGLPFMQKYDPDWKDLAPRDVVSRSIHHELVAQGVANVYLDLRSYIPVPEIRARFPNIYDYCLAYGVDLARDLVPVAPAAHYACGGVWVDAWGQTTVQRLYAVGEVACTGVHGANRLASTSLLEGLVWGNRAAEQIRQALAGQPRPKPGDIRPYQGSGQTKIEPAQTEPYLNAIKEIMWAKVGLMRTTSGLEQALVELRHWQTEIEGRYRQSSPTDALIGARNVAQVALLVTEAALENKVSVGCHYRVG